MPSWNVACLRPADCDLVSCNKSAENCDTDYEDRQSLNCVERRSSIIVDLSRSDDTPLGIIVSGGIDKGTSPKITNLRPGSIAHKNDSLAIGDYITAINGIHTSKLKHEEIFTLLCDFGDNLTLEIEYETPVLKTVRSPHIYSKVIQRKLERENNNSFGFTIRGGHCDEKWKYQLLTITHVRFGGAANRDGTIRAGDRLLAVDGINLIGSSLQEALNVIKNLGRTAMFTIEYDVSVLAEVEQASGPLLVEIDNIPGSQLGINLTCLMLPDPTIVIQSIRQASAAERCGALHVGDHVLAINGVTIDGMTANECHHLLKSSKKTMRIEIYPVCYIIQSRCSEINENREYVNAEYDGMCLNSYEPDLHRNSRNGLYLNSCSESHAQNSPDFGGSHSLQLADGGISGYKRYHKSRILEQLQDREESQLHNDSDNSHEILQTTTDPSSNRNFRILRMQFEELENGLSVNLCNKIIWNSQSEILKLSSLNTSNQCTTESYDLSSLNIPVSVEIHSVTLYKDKVYEDFGFSISDGLFENGVYISQIRTGGPADLSGLIKPYDRILQVNDSGTSHHDCCRMVPLIAASGDEIELLICRHNYLMYDDILSESAAGHNYIQE